MLEKSPANSAASPTARKTAGTTKPASRRTATRKGASGDLQAQIQRRAYELWEHDGRPHGRDHAHWQQAEREIGATRVAD